MNKNDIEALNEAYEQINELHTFDKPGIEEQDPAMYGAPVNVGQGLSNNNPIEIKKRAAGAGGANFTADVYFPIQVQKQYNMNMEKYLSSLYNELPEEFERDPAPKQAGGANSLFLRQERDFRVDVNNMEKVGHDTYEVDFDITFTNEGYGESVEALDEMSSIPSGVHVVTQAEKRNSQDASRWIKIIKDEMGIGPIGMASENVHMDLLKPISELFTVRKVQGRQMAGIKIMFDDGTNGLAFGVSPRSSVSKVLAATYKSYHDVFKKIAEEIIARSGDEYEGM